MRYFGGKTRICKDIAKIINEYNINSFISPFVGGGWVEQYVNKKKLLADKHSYLISMYQKLQEGWQPPKNLTKEEYDYIKNNPNEKPYLTGFVGFGCSFAGKWFGGYAKDNSGRNYCENAYNSILKKIENGLLDAEFICEDYKDFEPKGNIIYCDPPYEGTTQYGLVGKFNSNEFWDTMRKWSEYNIVLISEYNAPEDFEIIWQKETKLDIRNKENAKESRIERLFKLR